MLLRPAPMTCAEKKLAEFNQPVPFILRSRHRLATNDHDLRHSRQIAVAPAIYANPNAIMLYKKWITVEAASALG